MADWNNKANELFLRAAEIEATAQRRAFLEAECGADADLRRQVEALLSAKAQAGSFLDKPAAADEFTGPYRSVAEGPGMIIARYKLLQKIGEGGFGVVYMAEQEHPVRRKVALKIIKPGMDTNEVIARFESERQALAMMDHPNVARVLDAGTTGEPGGVSPGKPYFVMELVRGVPITEFCDKNHIPADQRLKLFIDVCHAIQHAHHKGVIHRDIKPANVMVTLHDGVPVVKVIDFGVAKATVQKLTERTLFTAYGQMIGTPAYMSPEQAEMSGLDIDTRSDIYSLGVLLYELLTGTTPLDVKRLRAAGYAEMQRLIREEEAPRPSNRLSSLGDSATVLAGNRGTDVKRLAQLLSGDLDWLVMKALEKDRSRRYGTPENFAEDIERYLRHEAILARPPSTAYRLRKFAQRNKAAVVSGSLVAAALLLATLISTWLAVKATLAEGQMLRERNRAVEAEEVARQAERLAQSEKQKAVTEKERADEQAAIAKAVNDFLQQDLLGLATTYRQALSGVGPDRDIKVRTLVDRAAAKIAGKFDKQPLVEAEIRQTLVMTGLLEPPEAERHALRARELYTRIRGPEHPDTLRLTYSLSGALARGRQDEERKLLKETLHLQRRILGPEHPDTQRSMRRMVHVLRGQNRFSEACTLAEETLQLERRLVGPEHPDTISSMGALAVVRVELGQIDEACKLREEQLQLHRRVLGPEHPDTLRTMKTLAYVLFIQGRLKEAYTLNYEAIELHRRILGPEDPETLATMNNQACFLATATDPKFRDPHRAVELAREVVTGLPKVGGYWNTLGIAQYSAGDWQASIAALEKSMELRKGGDSLDWFFLAMVHWQLGKTGITGQGSGVRGQGAGDSGEKRRAQEQARQLDEARQWYDKAVQWMEKNQPKNPELQLYRKMAAELLGIKKN